MEKAKEVFLRQVIYTNLKAQYHSFRREEWQHPFAEQELEAIAEATRTINRIIWGWDKSLGFQGRR